jgi:hypothetical protein
MSISSLILRPAAAAAALMAVSLSAHADLTIPANALVADSVQAFSDIALTAFELGGVTVTPLGNATSPVAGSYSFPITSITIGSNLKIVKGDARGSALQLTRTAKGYGEVSVTIANFTLDYNAKKVLADTTPKGGTTTKQMPIYNFNVATPLGFKYKFPLTITAHEVLDQLTGTDELKATMKDGLKLTPALASALDGIDTFGTLTQDIKVAFRSKPVSTTPYVPAP